MGKEKMAENPQAQERRERQRCPGLAYTAWVQRTSGLHFFSKPFQATIIDFHRFGACLCTGRKITVGTKIRLTMKSATEEVKGIRAVVCHVRLQPTGYWFGVKFIRSDKDKSAGQSVLAGLENMIRDQLA
jgi:PilZ domain